MPAPEDTGAEDEAWLNTMRRAERERYVQLRERFLEINPDVRGGEPVIRGTRVPIRSLAE